MFRPADFVVLPPGDINDLNEVEFPTSTAGVLSTDDIIMMGQGYYTMSTEPAVSVMYREPFCRCSFVGVLCRLRCELGRTNFQNSAPKF